METMTFKLKQDGGAASCTVTLTQPQLDRLLERMKQLQNARRTKHGTGSLTDDVVVEVEKLS